MENIIKFKKPQFDQNQSDDVFWEDVCNVIDRDFANTGLNEYAENFKMEFKPIFDTLFIGELQFPNIHPEDDNVLHQEWRNALEATKARLREHTNQLLSVTYLRELERFCKTYIV